MAGRFASFLLLFLVALPASAWWNPDWTQRTRILLNTSSAGVETREALTDVVIPVRLHSGNIDFVTANPDGSDLRLIAGDDKTPLAFAIERFDPTNELALVWVRVPTVLPGTDRNVLYAYAGNAKARAEPAAPVFDDATRAAFHFGEKDGPATDSKAGLKSSAPVTREANGLLGSSLRLAGDTVTWPAGGVDIPAGGALAVSLWIRPEKTAQGVLLRLGPLQLALEAGKLVAKLGTVAIDGGEVAPATWSHVGVALGGGKLVVYVDGKARGEAAVATAPAFGGEFAAGGGFEGQIDELRIGTALRGADWFRFEHAVQSADAKLVASTTETADSADGAAEGASYIGILVKNLTTDAWVVIAILGVMFVVAVWVMVTKAVFVSRADKANRRFLQAFRKARENLLHLQKEKAFQHSPLYRLYEAGLRELDARDIHRPGQGITASSLNAVKAIVDADLVRETHDLNARMVLLTIAISGGPFLGLLGTVVGVMITFAAIAAAGDVNVNAIAPGIAAALLATVAGLAVAIPALFGYNYLASRIKRISSDLQIFVDEFVARVDERYGAR